MQFFQSMYLGNFDFDGIGKIEMPKGTRLLGESHRLHPTVKRSNTRRAVIALPGLGQMFAFAQ